MSHHLATASVAIKQIETARLVLRIAHPSDAAAALDYAQRNKNHFAATNPAYAEDYFTEAYWKTRLADCFEEFRTDKSARFFMYLKHDEARIIGAVNLSEFVRRAAQFCYLGYGIDHEHEGQGFMYEAAEATIQYAFDELNLHRIMANYMPHNIRSGNLLKRLGFNVDGFARDYLRINGKWEDHIMTSKTNPNWKPI